MTGHDNQSEQLIATRAITASPDEVFAVLADPSRHRETEPGDWVRDAIDPQPITEVGQIFGMNMYFEGAPATGGDGPGEYEMHNRVVAFEPDRLIAWEPGQYAEGKLETGGWIWRYDVEPDAEATRVTLTYDWSATPQVIRDEVGGMPPFGADFLESSLASLEKAVHATP